MKFTPPVQLLSAMTGVALSLGSACGANIDWGTGAKNITGGISGNLDVSTAGTLVGALNLHSTGNVGTTVNGVDFQSLAVPAMSVSVSSGAFMLTAPTNGKMDATDTEAGFAGGSFATLSAPYRTLLESAIYIGEPITLTLSSLTVGALYQFQWWSNASDINLFGGDARTIATAGNSVTLLSTSSIVTQGNLGQFAIGTFIADGPSQTIAFTTMIAGPAINAFQLREIPEPGTTALIGAVLVCVAFIRRARR